MSANQFVFGRCVRSRFTIEQTEQGVLEVGNPDAQVGGHRAGPHEHGTDVGDDPAIAVHGDPPPVPLHVSHSVQVAKIVQWNTHGQREPHARPPAMPIHQRRGRAGVENLPASHHDHPVA
ncbi:MAG: hypothetical protein QOF95_1700, partial [Pseudonocardiales bacterium]|nr:hypothetical protein [Pseudonocardiales bacterium]